MLKRVSLFMMALIMLFMLGSVLDVNAGSKKKKPLPRPNAGTIQIRGSSICMSWSSWCPKDECANPGKAQIMRRVKKSKGWSDWKHFTNQDPDGGSFCHPIAHQDKGKTLQYKIVFKKGDRAQASQWGKINVGF